MVHQSNTAGKKPTLTPVDQKRILAKANDMSETMFNTIGACFNQLQTPSTNIKGQICFFISGPKRLGPLLATGLAFVVLKIMLFSIRIWSNFVKAVTKLEGPKFFQLHQKWPFYSWQLKRHYFWCSSKHFRPFLFCDGFRMLTLHSAFR